MDALHPPTPEKEEEAEEEDESAKKVPAYLVWLGKNWQWILIFAMCLKNQGLVEAVRMLLGGSP